MVDEVENVVALNSAQGSFLCGLSLFRLPDGSIRAILDDMPAHVIEAEATITRRFFKAAEWSVEGALDLMRQGLRFDEETRSSLPEEEGRG